MNQKLFKPITFIWFGIVIISVCVVAYLFVYMNPEYITEDVEIIVNNGKECIAETKSGYSLNIGPCEGKSGDWIEATYDKKVLEREYLMNPTN